MDITRVYKRSNKIKNMKINYIWDWSDFGIMFRVFKGMKYSNYYGIIDIQFGWLNIWIEVFKRNINI